MTTLQYLAQSIPWAAVGLLAGYMAGRTVRDLDVIAAAVTPEEPMTEPRRFRLRFNHILAAVVFLLAVGSVVQGYVYNATTQRIADCTRGYSNGFADAIDARSQASQDAQSALDDLMESVGTVVFGTDAGTPQARQRFGDALSEFLAKREEAKKQQELNPYPPPPRDVCK